MDRVPKGNAILTSKKGQRALLGTRARPVDLDAARRTLARTPSSASNLEALEIGWGMRAYNQVPEDDGGRSTRQASSPDADG